MARKYKASEDWDGNGILPVLQKLLGFSTFKAALLITSFLALADLAAGSTKEQLLVRYAMLLPVLWLTLAVLKQLMRYFLNRSIAIERERAEDPDALISLPFMQGNDDNARGLAAFQAHFAIWLPIGLLVFFLYTGFSILLPKLGEEDPDALISLPFMQGNDDNARGLAAFQAHFAIWLPIGLLVYFLYTALSLLLPRLGQEDVGASVVQYLVVGLAMAAIPLLIDLFLKRMVRDQVESVETIAQVGRRGPLHLLAVAAGLAGYLYVEWPGIFGMPLGLDKAHIVPLLWELVHLITWMAVPALLLDRIREKLG